MTGKPGRESWRTECANQSSTFASFDFACVPVSNIYTRSKRRHISPSWILDRSDCVFSSFCVQVSRCRYLAFENFTWWTRFYLWKWDSVVPSTWPGRLPIPPVRCRGELVSPRGDLLPYEMYFACLETGIGAIFCICHICSIEKEE